MVGTEVTLFFFFCLGFVLFNTSAMQALTGRSNKSKLLRKQLEADFASGNYEDLLQTAKSASWTVESVVLAIQALAELQRFADIVPTLEGAAGVILSLEGLHAVLPAVVTAPAHVVEAVRAWFAERGVEETEKTTELLVEAYTSAGDFGSLEQLRSGGVQLPALSYRKWVEDELQQGKLLEAAARMTEMQAEGLYVYPWLVAELARIAAQSNRLDKALLLLGDVALDGAAIGALLEVAEKGDHWKLVEGALLLASRSEDIMIALPCSAYESLCRAFARRGDPRGIEYWDKMFAVYTPTDQACAQVISLCDRNIPLAEHVLATARAAGLASVALYAAAIDAYGNSTKTCDLYARLLEDGFEPDQRMTELLIKAGLECGRLDFAHQLLRSSGLEDSWTGALLRACARHQQVGKALELLSVLSCDTASCNCVLDACVGMGDSAALSALFSQMRTSGCVDAESFNILLKDGSFGEELLADMEALGLSADEKTYCALIDAVAARGDTQSAWKHVWTMKAEGFPLDGACAFMMQALQMGGPADVDNALRLLEVASDELVTTLLDACIRIRDVTRLRDSWAACQARGAVPASAYVSAIRAHGLARDLAGVRAIWQQNPSSATLAAAVDAFVANGAVEEALRAVREVSSTEPGVYHAIIKDLAVRKRQPEAIAVYGDMRELKVKPSLATFNALIDVSARTGAVDCAAELFRDMCSVGVPADEHTYTMVIKGYCVQGDMMQAIQVFSMMRKRRLSPDALLFNTIIDTAGRKQMTSLGEQVFNDMESMGVKPTASTLATLVKLHGKNNDLDTALSYYEILPAKYNFEVTSQVYAAVVLVCACGGRMSVANELLEKIERPDTKTFSAVITGSLKQNDVAGAVRVLSRAVSCGVPVGQELIDNVGFMAERRKLGHLLEPLSATLRSSGYKLASCETETSSFHARRVLAHSWRDAE
jgi:pentatricopeptide repeat protein